MKFKSFRLAMIAAIVAGTAMSPALAGIVVSYDFSGEASAGGNSASLNDFPAGGVERITGFSDSRRDGPSDFAAMVGAGTQNPINFVSGAASAGEASASTDITVRVEITNDTGSAAEFFWNAVIFAGGVGYATPDLSSPGCALSAIENCDSFTNFTGARDGYSAELNFLGQLDGVELFSGDIDVNEGASNASFNGIALDGFGLASGNSSFYQWDETSFSQSLGLFADGETKVLEFIVSASVASANGLDCAPSSFENCYFSLAGFGDPPTGQGGGIGMSPQALFLSFDFDSNEIPVPPAMILFLTGAAAIAARRKKKKAG